MDNTPTECAAVHETVVFLNYFKDLHDPRQQGKVCYPLEEILLLCLLAVLAGAETITEIAIFGVKKLDLLRRFRSFRDGTPTHDHLGDILAVLDAGQFQSCFAAWVASITGIPEGVIAIDGKTSRRSGLKNKGKAAIHMVSAFAARQRLVLGQVKVTEKSNEIIAIPKLLDLLTIDGAIVTIDAMGKAGQRFRQAQPDGMARRGCQREIAQKIIDKKADYILALKGNQGRLRDDVELFVAEQKAVGFSDTTVSRHETIDGDHGRIETRAVVVIHDVAWLNHRHDWPGLKAVAVVESTREINGKTENETRFYISSLTGPAIVVGPAIRDHWSIENSLHWVLDMTFRDDECRVRTDQAPANLAVIRHMAQNLIRRAPDKQSLRLRRKAAGWDDGYLVSLLVA
jgi:predicted transposase YbfD/YdcC